VAVPVEQKVKASTGAAALSGIALWALSRYVFRGAVPDVAASWVDAIIPAAITFGAGYLARHSPRPPGDVVVTYPVTVPTAPPAPPAAPAPPAGM
jgi:hypothetical protein